MKISNSVKIKILFILAVFAFVSPLVAARKKKSAETSSSDSSVQSESKGQAIKLSSKKRTYFYKIESSIVEDVENGSPESLKSAMSKIRKNDSEYEDYEKVLINVASKIMELVWPSQKVNWEIPQAPTDNPYMGALESVESGVFDLNTGNVDFLSTILPCLLLCKTSADTSFYDLCKSSLDYAFLYNPDSVLANYLTALLFDKKADYTQAETYFQKAYEKSPETQEIVLAYAKNLRLNGKFEEAQKLLNTIEGNSDNLEVLKQNAWISFGKKDYDSAELYVAKVLQQNPNNLEFLLFRARILVEKNDYIHAVSLLDMYARQDSTSIDYLILRARVQLDWSKNTNAATETVEKALQLYPDNPDALKFAARISSQTDSPVAGKYADELAARVLQLYPQDSEALLYSLKGFIQRKNWQEAYNISKKLISSENASSEVAAMYVQTCLELGRNSEAYDFAKKQLEAKPDDEVILQSYVLAYSKVGSRDQVLKYIDSLLTSSSSKIKSYLYYRRSYLQLTEDNTLADLRSSLISNPRNSDALFRLYEMYFDKKDYRKAQYYLRQVVAINPNDSSIKQLNEALTQLMQ